MSWIDPRDPSDTPSVHKPISRRRMLAALFGAGIGAAALGAEGFLRGPRALTVERKNVTLPGFSGEFTLAHLSDLHYGFDSAPCESLGRLVTELEPDAVAITGDLLSDFSGSDRLERLLDLLPRPVYVVPGNWERTIRWSDEDQRRFYEKHDAVFLMNEHTRANPGAGSGARVAIIGVDDPFMGIDDLFTAAKGLRPDDPAILLSHGPIIAHQASMGGIVDLTLAGHTHGGQVRIPGLGPILLPGGSGEFDTGMYQVGRMKMYVNRGIGTCLIPIRLFCPPEVTLFTIRGAAT